MPYRARPLAAFPPAAAARHRLTLVVEPRFPGGTSAAVAAEIQALAGRVELAVAMLETAMFRGRRVHPAIEAACADADVPLAWAGPVIRGDTIVLHNPSCLRFDRRLPHRLSAADLVVVTHENLLRPTGAEAFDVRGCLGMIEAAWVGARRRLAPVSPVNRRTVEAWCGAADEPWPVAAEDWTNVLELPLRPPGPRPRDRRGRHSRPGLEKFPPLDALLAQFPPHAEACVILGGDALLAEAEALPPHWDVRPFGATPVAEFLAEIDFFVYFTSPAWSESFGRVIAEAVAAGKLVITDPETARSFEGMVVAAQPAEVDAVVAAHVAAPARYLRFVRAAQRGLARFAPEAFAARTLRGLLSSEPERRRALV